MVRRRDLSCREVVHRIWASARVHGGKSLEEARNKTAREMEEALSGAVDHHVHLFVAHIVESFDTVDRGIWTDHARVQLRFKFAAGLGAPWTRDWGISPGCPLVMFNVALVIHGVSVLRDRMGSVSSVC